MQLLKSTQNRLANFAIFCRTGDLINCPELLPSNIQLYHKLVLNVIEDTLQNAYPITHQLLTQEEWDSLVKEFFATHACQSNQIWSMPKEFYEWLVRSNTPILEKYIFLDELLWFEWIELDMFMMDDQIISHTKFGDILFSKLILNPEHRLLSFKFPVHLKNCEDISVSDKANYFVLANRNSNGDILFNEISAPVVRLIEYLEGGAFSIAELIEKFQNEFQLELTEKDQEIMIHFFENAYKQELIIGFKN